MIYQNIPCVRAKGKLPNTQLPKIEVAPDSQNLAKNFIPKKSLQEINAIVHSIKNLCGESSTPLAKVPRNRGSNQVCLLSRNRRKMDVKSTEVTFEH